MSDDLVSRLRDERHCNDWYLRQSAATALTEARAEIERLRKVVCSCATAIGNGAALSQESSLDFIELLPGEIAKHTDKLRRFLKCARDEGAEALDRATAAESELSILRARVREVVGGMLAHSCVADAGQDCKNEEDEAAERAARQLMEDLK